ncbi:hypothetical protein VaNZ11_005989 [Volvox africanus]|uniref:AMP-activated protein kinase glycogen-binding domain-containing protein n=1 Tax=Volvox africanus TaxID=51714 RepID=A0ABQ5RZN1_9CHLO|nr:hypothetical protein VaNZ11_005989 [Volvox africanus]
MLQRSSRPVPAQVASTSGCRPSARAWPWAVGIAGEKLHLLHNQQWTMLPGLKSAPSKPCPPTSAARSNSAVFRHPGELDLNLREYMVVLEKPVGLTLAPDPKTGQVVIQDIKRNSPAHKCGLIQVGDVVKCCSAVFGDDMWAAVDIRRVRWAINSRMGDVKLLLERGRRSEGGLTAWYCGGKAGVATREMDGMQLPYAFNGTTAPEDASSLAELPGAGRTLQEVFHRNIITQPPPSRRASIAAAARTAAVQRLRRELSEVRNMRALDLEAIRKRSGAPDGFMLPPTAQSVGARSGSGGAAAAVSSPSQRAPSGGGSGSGPPSPPPPVVDVVAPPPPSSASVGAGNGSANGSDGSGNSSGGAGGGGGGGGLLSGLKLGGDSPAGGAAVITGMSSDTSTKKVVSFLPWLLVACGRLEHRDMATIASSRSLGTILELSITRSQQQPPQPPGSGPTATAAATAGSSSSSGGKSGGFLVVRGSDLMPLASDVGRVSYLALLAAATAAANPSGGGAPSPPPPPPIPVGEEPPPPPPGSAAATAAMINGADVVAADGSSLVTTSLTDAAAASGGGAVSEGTGSNSKSGGGGGGGGGLGSSTMAFLNRSIFLNLRPSMPFASTTVPKIASPGSASATSASSASSPLSPSASGATAVRPSFSAPPSSRYDPFRVRHLLNAAASLQRLAFRRGGKLHRARRDACAVLLHCEAGMEADVAVLLAGWLHWYGRLPLQEAILAAETAMGATVDQALLEAGTLALLQGARDRSSRVVLTWKYGGLSAYVAGDVVASWSARVPMVRCRSPLGCKGDTHPGHFFLEVQGLRPGVYYYKYIVDGTWAVDSYSSKVLDAAGNWNNVLVVPEPPVVLTSREGLALARWQAARLALEAKMGVIGTPRG